MGLLMGSSSFLQSPLTKSIPSSSHRKLAKRKQPSPMAASMRGESPGCGGGESSRRRDLLLVGVSILPFLQLRAEAMEGRFLDSSFEFPLAWFRFGVERRSRGQGRSSQAFGSREPEPEKGAESASSSTINVDPDKEDTGKTEEQTPLVEQEISSPEVVVLEKTEAQGPTQEEEISSQETDLSEQIGTQNAPGSAFVSLLNVVGIISSGVLGALYVASQKEKTAMESAIESMKTKMSEKDSATALLKENFELELLKEQEERRKQVTKIKKNEVLLSKQLSSANGELAALVQKLKSERQTSEDLKLRIGQLENGIVQAVDERKTLEVKLNEKLDTVNVLQDKISLLGLEINDKEKNIEHLTSSLAQKELEDKKLSSVLHQTKSDLAKANSTVNQLKEEIDKAREELDAEKSLVVGLNDRIESLYAEKNVTDGKLGDLIKAYNDLKSSSEKKHTADSELLSEKDSQLLQLDERLSFALSQDNENQVTIAKLTKERDDAKALLEEEAKGMKKLKDDLQFTLETLEASRLEASNLSEELEATKISYEELFSKISVLEDDFETKEQLNSNLEKEKANTAALSDELESIKQALKTATEELSVISNELESVIGERESLKKELLDIYKKSETSALDLKEEKKVVATLNKELEASKKQMVKDSEARRALEADLDEATRSLDEMNKSALLLSKELENASSRTVGLEAENGMLSKSLVEQKDKAKEVQENFEDAQNLITRLGSERAKFEKRSKKLEEDLASAKGEILRLRRQIRMSKVSGNEHPTKEGDGSPVGVKKTATRRRRGGSGSESS